jgi:aldose 1-epimerase
MIHRGVFRAFLFALILAFSLLTQLASADPIQVVTGYGQTVDYQNVDQYILTNKQGASARLIDYGATLTDLFMPDRDGKMGDVVLGYDDAKHYSLSGPTMGPIVGRYSNRIGGGAFTIDGINYFVTLNQGMNCLHGGFRGLSKRMWTGECVVTPEGPAVRFSIVDHDGEEGFPGNLNVSVIYTLTNDNRLRVQYYATTDKPTPLNLSQHSFFNLRGSGDTDVLGYITKIYAPNYLPVDQTLIPTGEVAPVAGTPFDFTKAKAIGRDMKSLPPPFNGYDSTLVLDNPNGKLVEAAEVYDPISGRLMQCWTTEPSVHFSSGGNLAGVVGRGGIKWVPYAGFSLETQHYPDSPNHPNFPNTILRPGHMYRQVSEFRFSAPGTPIQAEQ